MSNGGTYLAARARCTFPNSRTLQPVNYAKWAASPQAVFQFPFWGNFLPRGTPKVYPDRFKSLPLLLAATM